MAEITARAMYKLNGSPGLQTNKTLHQHLIRPLKVKFCSHVLNIFKEVHL